eukprot:gnl/MRDRNA2_/MRDRNA2_27437_c0_seq2.p1 gnl/MRDRNA2_/MRDRNA2_27437_c0~~gnl/MRDRNA2_/MRDRNA2_27437_c0_seq2.p1  ORF type:complete len:236 (-),score=36.42 gnl/MRDRNA2_/MRDRNA2_27437_c0_seq2:6-629(-)
MTAPGLEEVLDAFRNLSLGVSINGTEESEEEVSAFPPASSVAEKSYTAVFNDLDEDYQPVRVTWHIGPKGRYMFEVGKRQEQVEYQKESATRAFKLKQDHEICVEYCSSPYGYKLQCKQVWAPAVASETCTYKASDIIGPGRQLPESESETDPELTFAVLEAESNWVEHFFPDVAALACFMLWYNSLRKICSSKRIMLAAEQPLMQG